MGRLQEYRAPRLGHPAAVWVVDGSDFPKQGRKSAGVARQYCGRLGKAATARPGCFWPASAHKSGRMMRSFAASCSRARPGAAYWAEITTWIVAGGASPSASLSI